MKKICIAICLLMTSMFSLSSCFKKDFDTPPTQSSYDPNLPVNTKISTLSTLGLQSSVARQITGDSIAAGIVVADDRSGNLYKEIVIQDSSAGITVLIDQNSIYTDYPVGRKVYIQLKGLYVGNYNGLPQIGYTVDNTGSMVGIPAAMVSTYLVKATYPNPVTPVDVTMAQLNANPNYYLNRLVRIDSVEFATADAGQVYAAPSAIASGTGRNVEDCSGDELEVYTSGYANFQPFLTPTGKGTLTGIYSIYKSSPQFIVRDTTDVSMTGARCDGSTITPPAFITIDSLRKMYAAAGTATLTLPSVSIAGIVILTNQDGNLNNGNIIVQNGDRGVSVYYGQAQSYQEGDSVQINVTGGKVSIYAGAMEISVGASAPTTVVSSGNVVTPRTMTIADINAQYASAGLEYTLVRVQNASISSGTYSGNKTLNDGTGTMSLYTGSTATFASQPTPTSPKSYTGVVNQYNNSVEMRIRNPSTDVQ